MKTLKMTGLLLLMCIVALGVTSCGGYSPKAAEKMVEKCDDGKMKKADWEQCIDWVEAYYNEQEEIFEDLIKDSKNEEQFEEKGDKLEEKFEEKWEDIEDIEKMLNDASNQDEMGKSVRKRWEKVTESHDKKGLKLYEKYQRKFNN